MFKSRTGLFLVILDILLVSTANISAFLLRFEGKIPGTAIYQFWELFFLIILIRILVYHYLGLYSWMWQYASVSALITISKAVTISSVIISIPALALTSFKYPISVLIIDWILNILLIGGVRFWWRIIEERGVKGGVKFPKRTLIVGAGDSGERILRDMRKHRELGYEPVGFIDDNPDKKGMYIHGVKVLGTRHDIPQVVRNKKVDEIIVAMPSMVGRPGLREIATICEETGAGFKIVPSVYELMNGKATLNNVREVHFEDLLGREQVDINLDRIAADLRGQRILVTGAGGSIGSELCRQLVRFKLDQLILLDQGENDLYQLDLELRPYSHDLSILPIVGDIQDKSKLRKIFDIHRPTMVFHAAAYKHVPLMERNPEEAVKNNIIGTKTLAEFSIEYEVEKFVMISTDKAVNPTSIMGASKRVAELIVQYLAEKDKAKFITVRFGNVLGSHGSVVPVFKKQIARGGPVTVTHPEMVRYFMTIPEAAQLVLQASVMGEGGEIFILDMGQPMKILDLARDLIKLSGYTPDKDIRIEFTGIRPGEKLLEELTTVDEEISRTAHQKIFLARSNDNKRSSDLEDRLEELEELANTMKVEEIIEKLKEVVPNYQPDRRIDRNKGDFM